MKPTDDQVTAARAVMRGEWIEERRREFESAKATLVSAGHCPCCAVSQDPLLDTLGEWQEGDYENHAGKECQECGEFFVCGPQPEYATAGDDCHSDADPGL